MSDPQTNRGVKRGRRWLPPTLLFLILGGLVLAYAPVFPYSLTCKDQKNQPQPLGSKFSENFIDGFAYKLRSRNITYIFYNRRILLRFENWLDGEGWALSAASKTIRDLADIDWGPDTDRPIDYIQRQLNKIRDLKTGKLNYSSCKLMQFVAVKGW